MKPITKISLKFLDYFLMRPVLGCNPCQSPHAFIMIAINNRFQNQINILAIELLRDINHSFTSLRYPIYVPKFKEVFS